MCAVYQKYGRDEEKGCDQPVVYGEELDGAVRLALEAANPNREEIARALEALYGELQAQSRESGERKRLEASLTRLRERRNRLLELRLDGEISAGAFSGKSAELEAEISRLEGTLKEAAHPSQPVLPSRRQIGSALEFEEGLPGCLIEGLVERIEVSGEGGVLLNVTLKGEAPEAVRVERKRGKPAELTLLPSVCSGSGT